MGKFQSGVEITRKSECMSLPFESSRQKVGRKDQKELGNICINNC
jgi:hypothetical protein